MSTKIKILLLSLLITSTIANVNGQVKKNKAAILATLAKGVEAWNTHNSVAFSEKYTSDADFTNVLGQSAHGRQNIDKFHSPLFSTVFKESKLTYTNIIIRFLTADIAAVDIRWNMTGVTTPDGVPRPRREGLANLIMMLEKGSWLIKISHNMNLPDLSVK